MMDDAHGTPPRTNGRQPPAILSRQQASAYLGVSVRTFDRIQKEAAIPYVTVGKRRKYLRADLESYLLSHRSV